MREEEKKSSITRKSS